MRIAFLSSLMTVLLLQGPAAQARAAAPLPASGLIRQVAAYTDQPELGPASTIRNDSLAVGRMTFSMDSGTLAPLLSGGRTLGFHFKGKGSFRYRSEEPLERATLISNYKKNLGGINTKAILTEEKGVQILTVEFKSFTFWQEGLSQVFPSGEPAEAPMDSFVRDFAYFRRDGLGDRGHDFAAHLANSPGKTLVRAEITGVDCPFLYTLDQGSGQREQLWSIAGPYRPAVYDGLRKAIVSDQPIGWNWKAPLSALLEFL